MKERTLLHGALVATALAASFGVYKARAIPPPPVIVPVARLDSARLQRAEGPPIRLTAADGTGLRLVSLRATAALEDPIALTELHLVFENPEERTLDGTFAITLPQGAAVTRFAMKRGDAWEEGIVVERAAAQATYAARQDAALLEDAAGNEVNARIAGLASHERREIVVTYTEVLESGSSWVLPLRGLPTIDALDVDVNASGKRSYGIHQKAIVPAQDFVVDAGAIPRTAGLRSDDLVLARVVPFPSSRPDPVESAVVLVDTSASRSLGLPSEVQIVRRTLALLDPAARVTVACFDQEVVTVYEGTAGGFGDDAVAAIVARGALGASNLQDAIRWAGVEAKRRGLHRVFVVGDGVATAGETDASRMKLEVEALRGAGVRRLDAIAVGGIRGDAFLRALAHGVLDRDGVVLDGGIGAVALARRLGEATSSGVPVTVAGARWWWPRTLDGLQSGDEVIVHAEVAAGTPVTIEVGGSGRFDPDLRPAARAVLERTWAEAKIQSLLEAPEEDAATTRTRIVALGVEHRIVSPYTTMLLGGNRESNIDILTIKAGRITPTPPPSTPTSTPTSTPPPSPTASAPVQAQKKAVHVPPAYVPRRPAPRPVDRDVGKNEKEREEAEPWLPRYRGDRRAPPPPQPEAPVVELWPVAPPYEGRFATVMGLLAQGDEGAALAEARRWHDEAPSDPIGLVALGESFEATAAFREAARAYGSLLDLGATRIDWRRFASERLERLQAPAALVLAIDSYAKALALSPQTPSGRHLYALALLRHGDHEKAFATLASRPDPVLVEDLGLVAAAWSRAEPARASEIRARLAAAGGELATAPSVRFVLVWESGATDLDLAVRDANHRAPLERAANVTTGWGPESVTVREGAGPFRIDVRYAARGAAGYSLGKVEIVEHDGKGNVTFDERPFVLMTENGTIDLGSFGRRTKPGR